MKRSPALLLSSLVPLLCASSACYRLRPDATSQAAKTTSTTQRVTPVPVVGYPEGVAPPVVAVVVYPAAASLRTAVSDYLRRARDRGATWFSRLALVSGEDRAPCAQPLIPATVPRGYDATYQHRGATGSRYTTRTERVDVPLVRAIDDLNSILEDIDIYVANNPARCAGNLKAPSLVSFKLEGGIHGREGIGVRPGPGVIDLTLCGKPVGASKGVETLALGMLDNVNEVEATLAQWMKSEVRLLLEDRVITGTLERMSRGVIVIALPDGSKVETHYLDATAIERDDPRADPKDPTGCKYWRPEGQLL